MTGSVLMRPDPMGRSFAFAIALHGSLLGVVLLVNWLNANRPQFGDPNAGGASVGVEAVDKIPLPHSGPSNPVAHQTESEAPEAPPEKVAREKQEVVPPDAVKLNLKQKKAKAKEESVRRHLPSFDQLEKNQLYSKTPQAVSSPMFTQMPGSGRVGLGANTTLGTMFAAYAQQIQILITQNWRTGDVTVQTAPPVVASFDLMKDGSIRNLAIVQGSGVSSLDFSVRRAIEGVTFPPLPTGFPRNSAKCEFTFELKK
ncbi:MAG: cell envelope integrity protein TolA [Bryobacteraceae bacterium]|jgi:TonB family protein